MAFAPLAHAAPPEGLAGTPIGEIYTLVGEGYDVQMHWDAGQPADVPLALCTVTGVDVTRVHRHQLLDLDVVFGRQVHVAAFLDGGLRIERTRDG